MNAPTQEAVELRPCPFCGAPAELADDERRDSEGTYPVYMAGCSECPATVGTYSNFETPAEAADAWNRRAGEDLAAADDATQLRARLSELGARLSELRETAQSDLEALAARTSELDELRARWGYLRETLERIENMAAEDPHTNWTREFAKWANLALYRDDTWGTTATRPPRAAELLTLLHDLWRGANIGANDAGFVNVPPDVTRRVVAALREAQQ